jgi:hypothetical protein
VVSNTELCRPLFSAGDMGTGTFLFARFLGAGAF